MRISDWSSDVCSSDLTPARQRQTGRSRRLFSRGPICEKVPAPWRRRLIASTGLQLSGASVRGGADHKAVQTPLRRFRLRPQSSRSEEHTAELQSLMRIPYAVFCWKKTTKNYKN